MSDQKPVIVSGGTYGLGLGMTLLLASQGYAVVSFGLDAPQTGSNARSGRDKTRAALEERGLSADLLEADVADETDVQRVVDFTIDRFGKIHGVVNNAAIHPTGTVETTEESEWDRVLDVNLKGVFLLSKKAVPYMAAGGGGSIVNIGSASAWGRTNLVAYCASKGGVLALSAAMARDHLGDHIRVNVVVPGGKPITGMTEGVVNEASPVPTVTGGNTTADDVAQAVAYLLSDAAANVSGSVLTVGCFLGQGGPIPARQGS